MIIVNWICLLLLEFDYIVLWIEFDYCRLNLIIANWTGLLSTLNLNIANWIWSLLIEFDCSQVNLIVRKWFWIWFPIGFLIVPSRMNLINFWSSQDNFLRRSESRRCCRADNSWFFGSDKKKNVPVLFLSDRKSTVVKPIEDLVRKKHCLSTLELRMTHLRVF